ncbi:Scr1 family TA system antitoxin-like transcriptional regulator [Streptomyces sp. NPDC088725]|uniref:Scr1 family TA system antitoxin-like transcriptional regulator n=1 Tax=Streptomyces sp. NPDC088725 TaxID=3365873 RepID=UPI0037F41097
MEGHFPGPDNRSIVVRETSRNDEIASEPGEVEQMRRRFDELAAAACDPETSMRFVEEIRRELEHASPDLRRSLAPGMCRPPHGSTGRTSALGRCPGAPPRPRSVTVRSAGGARRKRTSAPVVSRAPCLRV